METWHFIPWTLQYLVSACFIIAVSATIFSKYKTSLAYQSFFIYAICTAVWLMMAFFHRNAPTPEISGAFFRIDIFLVLVSFGFLPVFVFCLRGAKKEYLWLVIPTCAVGLYYLVHGPHEIFWSDFGWSYRFTSGFAMVFLGATLFSLALLLTGLIRLTRSNSSRALVQKYTIAFILYLFFYSVGMAVTTVFLQKYPKVPPVGGILTLIQFMFIAYAASLEPEKIITYSELKRPINELAELYAAYLNKFQEAMPGTELGENIFRFQDYIEAMGQENIVVSRSGSVVFNADNFNVEHLYETPDNIIRVVKELPWANKIINDLGMVLHRTYETLHYISESRAEEWLRKILEDHAGFLLRHGILADIFPGILLPAVFQEIQPGRVTLFFEDNPQAVIEILKKVGSYHIRRLCLTKYSLARVFELYGLPEEEALRVGYEKAESAVEPGNTIRLSKAVSDFLASSDSSVVMFDCVDQIKFAIGFEALLVFLKNIISLVREHGSALLIIIPMMMFDAREKEALTAASGMDSPDESD